MNAVNFDELVKLLFCKTVLCWNFRNIMKETKLYIKTPNFLGTIDYKNYRNKVPKNSNITVNLVLV